jgi:hypothetical protein
MRPHGSERRVLGESDCPWGLLDGLNDAAPAVSLTFRWARNVMGPRFAAAHPAVCPGDLHGHAR